MEVQQKRKGEGCRTSVPGVATSNIMVMVLVVISVIIRVVQLFRIHFFLVLALLISPLF